jgi:hypothetical protein
MSIDGAEPLICPARVTLDAAQSEFLDRLGAAAPSLQSELGCELEPGHSGSHAALAQHVEDTTWWVQWTLTASEIKPYTWCGARRTPAQQDLGEDGCSLFDGHPGGHSSDKSYWENAAA